MYNCPYLVGGIYENGGFLKGWLEVFYTGDLLKGISNSQQGPESSSIDFFFLQNDFLRRPCKCVLWFTRSSVIIRDVMLIRFILCLNKFLVSCCKPQIFAQQSAIDIARKKLAWNLIYSQFLERYLAQNYPKIWRSPSNIRSRNF